MRLPRFFKRSASAERGKKTEGGAVTGLPEDRREGPEVKQPGHGRRIRLPPAVAAVEVSSTIERESFTLIELERR